MLQPRALERRLPHPWPRPSPSGLGQNEQAIALYRDMLRDTRVLGCSPMAGARALKTVRTPAREADRVLPRGGPRPSRFRRCLLEPRQPENLSVRRRRDRHDARHRGGVARAIGLADRPTTSASLSAKPSRIGGKQADSWLHYERGNALEGALRAATKPRSTRPTRACRLRSAPEPSSKTAADGARRAGTRSSWSACRGLDQRSSSRSWRPTAWLKAPRNSPTSKEPFSTSPGPIQTTRPRPIRRPWPT